MENEDHPNGRAPMPIHFKIALIVGGIVAVVVATIFAGFGLLLGSADNGLPFRHNLKTYGPEYIFGGIGIGLIVALPVAVLTWIVVVLFGRSSRKSQPR